MFRFLFLLGLSLTSTPSISSPDIDDSIPVFNTFATASAPAVDGSISKNRNFITDFAPFNGIGSSYSRVVGTSCTDLMNRFNNFAITTNQTLRLYSLLKATLKNSSTVTYICSYSSNALRGNTDIEIYPSATLTPNWSRAETDFCPDSIALMKQTYNPDRVCSPQPYGNKYCGFKEPDLISSTPAPLPQDQSVSGLWYNWKHAESFNSVADCEAWAETGTAPPSSLSDQMKAALEAKLNEAMEQLSDESYTDESRSSLHDVIDSINSNYPESDFSAQTAIDNLQNSIDSLIKKDPSETDDSEDSGAIVAAIKDMKNSLISTLTNSFNSLKAAVQDVKNSILNGFADLSGQLSSMTDLMSDGFDRVVDANQDIQSSIDAASQEASLKSDEVKQSIEDASQEASLKSDEVKQSIEDASQANLDSQKQIKDSLDEGFDRVVDAVNSNQPSTGDVIVNIEGSNLSSVEDKLDQSNTNTSAIKNLLEGAGFAFPEEPLPNPEEDICFGGACDEPEIKQAVTYEDFSAGITRFNPVQGCPAPKVLQTTFLGKPFTFSFSFDLFCHYLQYVGNLVLFFSYFSAAMFVVRYT